MIDKVKGFFKGEESNPDKQVEKFREKVDKIKQDENDNRVIVDRSDFADIIDNSILGSYYVGYHEATQENESNDDKIEKIVLINLLATGLLIFMKIAPKLGL